MVSIVIPAYNEEKAIKQTLDEIIKIIKVNSKLKGSEIIVVNDGSLDNTKDILEEYDVMLINNPHNMGYGYSLKRGIMAAKNELIVTIDADGTYPFSYITEMLKKKEEGFDLVVGARSGKYYKGSIFKNICRKMLKRLVEYVTDKKIKDVNSGFRIFDKKTVVKYLDVFCNTFSFSTSQTLCYTMNSLFVGYVDIPYNKRYGKTKVKFLKDSLRSLKYIIELSIYYNPFKIFSLLTIICIILSIIGFLFSHYAKIKAGYILGIGGLLVSIIVFSLGLLAVLLKQIMNKNEK
ncbi:MAG: glycosyltransferase family 2 protein [Bacilli bacterium]|nr:glycosyltransferase family 2 protein [Bacilli bacterium]